MSILKGCLIGILTIFALSFITTAFGIKSCANSTDDIDEQIQNNSSTNEITEPKKEEFNIETLLGMQCKCIANENRKDTFFINKDEFYTYLKKNLVKVSSQFENDSYGRLTFGEIKYPNFEIMDFGRTSVHNNRASFSESKISGDIGELSESYPIQVNKNKIIIEIGGTPYESMKVLDHKNDYFRVKHQIFNMDGTIYKSKVKIWKCRSKN